uniref:Uncharacterized protein n=1 Tax=Globodera rostochiensis TaxID=31243 RepID=A0A914HRU7_GLORO
MKTFSVLIFVAFFFATNSLDKAESVKLELKTFDEIFGEGWWDKGEAEDLKTPAPTNFGQNVHHQIDRQNTQIGQIEPNSTDQNPPLTGQKVSYEKEERKHFVEKFDQMKAELKRAGLKNSYKHEIDETVAKELGITDRTIYRWKRKLGQTEPKHMQPHSEQKELIKCYYEIKNKNPKMSVGDIAKMLKIGRATLYKWKKQFKRQQFYPNSVDSVENAAANIQEKRPRIWGVFE